MAMPDGSPSREVARPNGPSASRRSLPLSVRVEIGERDGWVCGICLDLEHPVVRPGSAARGPLSAAVDHIVSRNKGGTDDPVNLQLAHRFCNGLKHAGHSPHPAYATARLRWKLYGTPVPGRLWVRRYPVSEPICPKVIKAQLRQIHWELLARQADRGHFQLERTQIMLRLRLWRARRRAARRSDRRGHSEGCVRMTLSLPSRRIEVDESHRRRSDAYCGRMRSTRVATVAALCC